MSSIASLPPSAALRRPRRHGRMVGPPAPSNHDLRRQSVDFARHPRGAIPRGANPGRRVRELRAGGARANGLGLDSATEVLRHGATENCGGLTPRRARRLSSRHGAAQNPEIVRDRRWDAGSTACALVTRGPLLEGFTQRGWEDRCDAAGLRVNLADAEEVRHFELFPIDHSNAPRSP